MLSFRELLDLTQEWADRSRGYLPMPFWLAKLQALLTWPLPNSLRPITLDQVRMLQHDNMVSAAAKSEGRTLAGLGVAAPHGVAAIVPTYLERFRARGQFAHYRTCSTAYLKTKRLRRNAGASSRCAQRVRSARAMHSVHAGDLQIIVDGMADRGLPRVGKRQRGAVGRVQREQVDAFRQPLDGREHTARFVGGERLDVGDDASAESGKLVLGHDITRV